MEILLVICLFMTPQSLDEKRVCKVQPLGVQANAD